jgi:hypothetical protein
MKEGNIELRRRINRLINPQTDKLIVTTNNVVDLLAT